MSLVKRSKVLFNIVANSTRRRNFSLMVEKVVHRLDERRRVPQNDSVVRWCEARAESWEAFAQELDFTLWTESMQVCGQLALEADAKLNQAGISLGGPGHYPLLYFMTRYMRSGVAVETGVAAGWSSLAILKAMDRNGGGKLYSSDFPYFRLENPEKHIGCVVEERLKPRWSLLIDGDRNNLPVIAEQIDKIDLFHYDSDKTYSGREFAWACIGEKLSPHSVILFDDVQDNSHFCDLAASLNAKCHVFGFGGKYVGMVLMADKRV